MYPERKVGSTREGHLVELLYDTCSDGVAAQRVYPRPLHNMTYYTWLSLLLFKHKLLSLHQEIKGVRTL
jgi:hypothetical protein